MTWIADLLRFDRDGDVFTIREPAASPVGRLFGGLIAAQALTAAGNTVDAAKLPQSLHAYFVRGGHYDADVAFHVERTRDGRSFATRRVTAVQDDAVILEMIASFHQPEPGLDWQPEVASNLEFDTATPKESLLDFSEWIELRTVPGDATEFAIPPFWVRTRTPIEDDPLIRAATLTFLSDLGPVPAALPPEAGHRGPRGASASLDHALWFHRPFCPDTWHRYEVHAVNHNDSRGLSVGSMYDAAGGLVASVTQEALWRL